jgi:hypothetical protein
MHYKPLCLALAAALIAACSSAQAEMQRLRVCIGETAAHCDGTFSDFYKIRRGLKGDVDHIAGNAICTMAKGHLLSVNPDDARETQDGDCCGYVFVTIECEIDPVSQLPPSRAR